MSWVSQVKKRLETPFKMAACGQSDRDKLEQMLVQIRGEIRDEYGDNLQNVKGPNLRNVGGWSEELTKIGIDKTRLREHLSRNTASTPTDTQAPGTSSGVANMPGRPRGLVMLEEEED